MFLYFRGHEINLSSLMLLHLLLLHSCYFKIWVKTNVWINHTVLDRTGLSTLNIWTDAQHCLKMIFVANLAFSFVSDCKCNWLERSHLAFVGKFLSWAIKLYVWFWLLMYLSVRFRHTVH